MAEIEEIRKRKQRGSSLAKTIKGFSRSIYGYSIPVIRYLQSSILKQMTICIIRQTIMMYFRYGLIPGLLYYSIYHTEPAPTLSDLLNPFY